MISVIFAAVFPLDYPFFIKARDMLLHDLNPHTNIFLLIAGIAFTLHLVMFNIRVFTKSDTSDLRVFYIFLVLVIVRNYSEVIKDFDGFTSAVTGNLLLLRDGERTFAEHNENRMKARLLHTVEVTGDEFKAAVAGDTKKKTAGFFSLWLDIEDYALRALSSLLGILVAGFFATCAVAVVSFFAIFLSLVLYALGPLVIVFSYLPGFGAILKKWLTTLMALKAYFITITLIDLILYATNANLAPDVGGGGLGTTLGLMVMQLVGGVLYIMVPYITDFYLPSSTGGFMTMASGAVTMAAQAGMAASTAGASAAAKVAGAVGKT